MCLLFLTKDQSGTDVESGFTAYIVLFSFSIFLGIRQPGSRLIINDCYVNVSLKHDGKEIYCRCKRQLSRNYL